MVDDRLREARILMVDDEEANLQLLRRILEPRGFENLKSTTRPRRGLEIVEEWEPDLVLLDLLMPAIDGFEFLSRLRDRNSDRAHLPVLILTADHTPEAKRRALAEGANDFLVKPLSPSEVRLRVRNLLRTRFLHRTLHRQNALLEDQKLLLEDQVRERTSELEQARLEILHRLAQAAEYRDDETGEHTKRVGATSAAIGRQLGLPTDRVKLLRTVAPLHDVGKIGIPDHILLSPDPLTDEEFEVMKTHTTIGADLLGGSEFRVLEKAAEIALTHHERWDGRGYPEGLSGENIPLSGRIVAVADTFDALMHSRPYKSAWPMQESLAEIRAQRGAQFDPVVVDAFSAVVPERQEETVA